MISRTLKMIASFVLGSSKSSTCPEGTPPVSTRLRPCWTAILSGLVTRYAHCSTIDVEVGALVKRGQLVAKVGTSGRSTGSHLHFEVLVGGVPQDPARFLAGNVAPRAEFAARPGKR